MAVDLSYDLGRLYESSTSLRVRQMQTSMKTVVDNVAGAGQLSEFGMYSYSNGSPGQGGMNLPAQRVQDSAGRSAAKAAIESLNSASIGRVSPRNWDAAFRAVLADVEDGANYQTLYVQTAAFPTQSLNHGGRRNYNPDVFAETRDSLRALNAAGVEVVFLVTGTLYQNNKSIRPEDRNGYNSLPNGTPLTHRNAIQWIAEDSRIEMLGPGDVAGGNQGYDLLHQVVESDFASQEPVTGCLRVTKSIDNADGQSQSSPAGWEFSAEATGATIAGQTTLRTGADGSASRRVAADGAWGVTLTETVQDGYALHDYTCLAWTQSGRATTLTTTVDRDRGEVVVSGAGKNDFVDCVAHNRPTATLTVVKSIATNNDWIRSDVEQRYFDYRYRCTLDGETIVDDVAITGVTSGSPAALDTELPVGAECTITEQPVDTVDVPEFGSLPEIYYIAPTWASTGTDNTAADGYTYNFRVASPGTITVSNTNTFEADLRTIAVDLDNHSPGMISADNLSVDYTCRYVPYGNTEEIGGTLTPGQGPSGTLRFPATGAPAMLPEMPVGMQCTYTISDIELPPGYTLESSWHSNVCHTPGEGGMCATNFTFLPVDDSPQDPTLTLRLEAVPTVATLNVSVSPQGNAARLTPWPVTVTARCGDNYERSDTVDSTDTAVFDDVPVGTTCEVTETIDPVDGVDITPSAPQQVEITDPNATYSAVLQPELNYLARDVVFTLDVDTSQLLDLGELAYAEGAAFTVTATCTAGDGTQTQTTEQLYDGDTLRIDSQLPGTTCTFTITLAEQNTDYPWLLPQISAPQIVVEPGTGDVTGTGQVTWEVQTNNIVITVDKNVNGSLPDGSELTPNTFEVSYQCEISSGTNMLRPGERWTITDIPGGELCTFTQRTVDDNEFYHRTTVFEPQPWTQGELPVYEQATDGGTQSLDARLLEVGEAVQLRIVNTYAPNYVDLSVTKNVVVRDQDGAVLAPEVADVLVPADQNFSFDVRCTRSGDDVFQSTLTGPRDQANTAAVPYGSNCVVEEQTVSSATGVQPVVTGELVDGSTGAVTAPRDVEFTNTYEQPLTTFNLKKKVDGEGVARISNEQRYIFDYTCRVGTAEVASGTFDLGRFDPATQSTHRVPVGSVCDVTESPASAEVADADWSIRWAVANQPDASGEESTCANSSMCETTDEAHAVSYRMTSETNERSLVAWNTYTFHKATFALTKELAGDGPGLAEGDTFTVNYTCTPATGLGLLPAEPITGTLTRTGPGDFEASTPVPLGSSCTLVETAPTEYGGVVTAEFSGDGVVTNTQPPHDARLTLDVARGEELPVRLVNTYARPRADLTVSKTVNDSAPGSVAQWINDPDEFEVSYRCTDPHTDADYTGTVTVPAGGSAEIVRDPDSVADGVDPRLPADVTCSVTEVDPENKIPAGYADTVDFSALGDIRTGDSETVSFNGAGVGNVGLSQESETTVSFVNSYLQDVQNASVIKIVEGDDEHRIVSDTEAPFTFTYRCEYGDLLLPGQPAPVTEWEVTVGRDGEVFDYLLPTGTQCTFAEQADSEILERLEANDVVMTPNVGLPATGTTDTQLYRTEVPLGEEFTLTVGDNSEAVWFNSIYRNEARVVIQQVNDPDAKDPVAGSLFDIYTIDAAGNLGSEPVVTGIDGYPGSAASLAPGTYALVQTQAPAGASLLPQPWSFTVTPVTEDQEPFADLQFILTDTTAHSGIIWAESPAEGEPASAPWTIYVANLMRGALPLTGSIGVWIVLALGALAMIGGITWRTLLRRRG